MRKQILFSLLGMLAGNSEAFISTSSPSFRDAQTNRQLSRNGFADEQDDSLSSNNRRDLIASSVGLATLAGLPNLSRADGTTDAEGLTVFKTQSGLKYIELEPGNADSPSPRYGQLCVFSYTSYMKLPNKSKPEKFDTSSSFVTKHGNGRMIPGLDEGLHTMKKGGLRRLIIPPKLGFVTSGLGPLPSNPFDRMKLNNLLDEMVKQQGGNLVYEVRLKDFFDDEADQGYYEDEELSAEEFAEIQRRLDRSGGGVAASLAEGEGQA